MYKKDDVIKILICLIILHTVYCKMSWHISGLRGSCLVIPCSYDYSAYPPWNPYRVVWYQHVSRGYPVVYDSWDPGSVIQKFRGKTSLYGNPHTRDCSLLIKDLNLAHHGEKLYAVINIESKCFYLSFKIFKPFICQLCANIGDTVSVQCSTYHTCPYNKPTISLSGINNKVGTSDQVENRAIGDGKYRITLTRRGVVQAETKSTLKFTAKASDNGKDITCRTEIKGNVQTVKITLKIKPLVGLKNALIYLLKGHLNARLNGQINVVLLFVLGFELSLVWIYDALTRACGWGWYW
uniref:Immunoglobulin subtype domain-containing protein n=1 Tax=Astyanax mexicanus TaxID=7994 RepID=A0A8B9K8M2_ASTMX